MAMTLALNFAITGVSAVELGYDKTPEYALTCWPVTPANSDLYSTLSRWDLALQ